MTHSKRKESDYVSNSVGLHARIACGIGDCRLAVTLCESRIPRDKGIVAAGDFRLPLGQGMGLAKAAELNGYPGPAHVLELAAQLDLTPEQEIKTEVLFKKMQARAIPLGKELVEEERALDRLFASRAVNSESLGQALARIGRLQGQVRQVHLDAHVEQTALLTPAQVEK